MVATISHQLVMSDLLIKSNLDIRRVDYNSLMSQQYLTPLPQQEYQRVSLITAVIGFFVLAYFFIYQGAYRTKDRSLVLEVILAVVASGLIGVGIFLGGISVGIYM